MVICFSVSLKAQSADEQSIRKQMGDQVRAWNQGNIEDFMKIYWKDDSLAFIGHGGISYGYNNTLNNYKKNYSDSLQMGKLFFMLIRLKRLSPEYYFVIGKWYLKRQIGDLSGYYTILFQKIKGKWYIITDHSS
jgi:ketosteroid isomerase-like protein